MLRGLGLLGRLRVRSTLAATSAVCDARLPAHAGPSTARALATSRPRQAGDVQPPSKPTEPPAKPIQPETAAVKKAELTKDEGRGLSLILSKLKDVETAVDGARRSPVVESGLTALIGILVLVIGGGAYVTWYKHNVLYKIDQAFAPGYDPALELANRSGGLATSDRIQRREQAQVDRILAGEEVGHYYLLLGPKGTGKGSMIMDAMRRTQADGAAVCEVHGDLEVFRVRLGKAINYDYNEDAQFGLFQRRDPKEGGPALDIERALNKLEKVALRSASKRGKPLVLVFNNLHQLRNDDDGRALVRLLQQRAESWAESGILTMVFCSDDFWPYTVLRQTANRLEVMSVSDLSENEAVKTLRYMRQEMLGEVTPESRLREAVRYTGGRLALLHRIGHERDLVAAAKETLFREKAWLLSQIGLIPDHDDDVMDEQKWASCSWLLLQEFVRLQKEQESKWASQHTRGSGGSEPPQLPSIPYWRCRQIMTRGDFLEALDHINVISIDINHDVRPDSVLILQAAREVCDEPGFQDALDNVLNRVDEIESLHRTRELTLKKSNSTVKGWFW